MGRAKPLTSRADGETFGSWGQRSRQDHNAKLLMSMFAKVWHSHHLGKSFLVRSKKTPYRLFCLNNLFLDYLERPEADTMRGFRSLRKPAAKIDDF